MICQKWLKKVLNNLATHFHDCYNGSKTGDCYVKRLFKTKNRYFFVRLEK